MILPDLNLLLYAHTAQFKEHEAARKWWDATLNGDEEVALCWVLILGFVRLTTRRGVLEHPMPVKIAENYVLGWLAQPVVRIIEPGFDHARELFNLLRHLGTAANLTTDAHLAALAKEYDATLCTNDRDFERMPGLRWHNPLTS